MDYGIHLEHRAGIAVLTVSNPTRRNALDPQLLAKLKEALSPDSTADVRAWLLRGAGEKAFCSGYDLSSLAEINVNAPLPDEPLGEVLSMLEQHPAPSVALIRGAAFGAGCELACACDFRVGADDSLFCMPPSRLGVVYAPEGLYRLMALLGRSRAKLMFLSGRRVPAPLAFDWGLLDEVHAAAEAEAGALRLCEELAEGAPLAIRGMKKAFSLLARPPLTASENEELYRIRRAAFQSEDVQEGRRAFLEKRPPRFHGR